MIVVGDASVFIALERIDAMALLPAVYGEIHVPSAVWREVFVSSQSPQRPVPGWVVKHDVPNTAPLTPALASLDAGEIEAIQLALSLHADLLLIDESAG